MGMCPPTKARRCLWEKFADLSFFGEEPLMGRCQTES